MKNLTEAAQAAKMIREILKKSYPATRFRVTSENFSMGNSVNVRWEDGPKTEEVDKIVETFKAGDFDGMTDCYNYRKTTDGTPRAKYISCTREPSEATRARIIAFVRDTFESEFTGNGYSTFFKTWEATVVYQFFTGARESEGLVL